mmetsp:Transcript_38584/g.120530  ORF Transcript_38584/g.120530 Transcript_38584/m.120530 type:complete len:357 (+) Transcript_38584:365-1435(+)
MAPACLTPFSCSSCRASSRHWGPQSSASLKARCSLSGVICDRASSKPYPEPSRLMAFEVSNWSAKTGVTTAGVPARNAACAVPEPPWWTTQLHCGNSQSCGAKGTKQTCSTTKACSPPSSARQASSRPSSCSRAQPPSTTPRRPARRSAPTARSSIAPGVRPSTSMEPQPTATGAGPAARKRRSAASCARPSGLSGEGSGGSTQAEVRCRRCAFGSGTSSMAELAARNCGRVGSTCRWSSKMSRVALCSHTGIVGTQESCSWCMPGPLAPAPQISACGWNSLKASSAAVQTPGLAFSHARLATKPLRVTSAIVPLTPPRLSKTARVSAKTGTASMPRSRQSPMRFAFVKARSAWWC